LRVYFIGIDVYLFKFSRCLRVYFIGIDVALGLFASLKEMRASLKEERGEL